MDRKLFGQAMTKFFSGMILMGVLLFVPAGTLHWKQAWLLMGILFIPMFAAGLIMMRKDPELLRKRLDAREFLAAFLLAGLNVRFRWMILPAWVSFAAAALFLLGYVLYGEVLRENRYLSRTVEVQEGQKVIDTGLYGIVRHPMYLSTLILFLAMPLVLGSVPSFAVMLVYIPIIALRIRNEEKVLEEGLDGYGEYRKRVRWKVIPFLW